MDGGKKVWVPHPTEGFKQGYIVDIGADQITVDVGHGQVTILLLSYFSDNKHILVNLYSCVVEITEV